MCFYGPRRPDWTQHGAPTTREVAEMRVHRRWVLGGFPSLAAADTHVSIGARERGQSAPAKAPAKATSLREAIGAPVALPRPPGIAADHPLVASGVLA